MYLAILGQSLNSPVRITREDESSRGSINVRKSRNATGFSSNHDGGKSRPKAIHVLETQGGRTHIAKL